MIHIKGLLGLLQAFNVAKHGSFLIPQVSVKGHGRRERTHMLAVELLGFQKPSALNII